MASLQSIRHGTFSNCVYVHCLMPSAVHMDLTGNRTRDILSPSALNHDCSYEDINLNNNSNHTHNASHLMTSSTKTCRH